MPRIKKLLKWRKLSRIISTNKKFNTGEKVLLKIVFFGLAILVFTILVSNLIYKKLRDNPLSQALQGIVFGLGAALAMKFPLEIFKGFIFDARSVFISIATLFFGYISGLIAGVITLFYRLYLGGDGAWIWIIGMTECYVIAYLFHRIGKQNGITVKLAFKMSFAIHLVALIILGITVPEQIKKYILLIAFYMLAVFPPITAVIAYFILKDRKHFELLNELKDYRLLLENTIQHIHDSIVITKLNKKVVFVNKKASQTLGKTSILKKNIEDTIKFELPNGKNILPDLINQCKKTKREVHFPKECYLAAGDKIFPVTGSIVPLKNEQGVPQAFLFIFSDISAEKEVKRIKTLILDSVQEGIEYINKNFVITYINQAGARLLKAEKPEDLIGKHIWDDWPEVRGSQFHIACKEALKKGKPVFMEHFFHPWNIWIENRIYPAEHGLIIFFSDITEKKKLELELKKHEVEMKAVLKLHPALVFKFDPYTRENLFVSENIEEILGFTVEEASKPGWWKEHIHPDDLKKAEETFDTAFVEGHSTQQFRFRKKDGTTIWILEKQLIHRSENKEESFGIGVWIDITSAVQTSNALVKSEERFKKLFFNETVPMLIINSKTGKIIDANPAACKFYQYGYEEMQNKNFSELTLNKDRMLKVLKNENNFTELEQITATGKAKAVEFYGIPIHFENGDHIFAIIHDITAKKRIEQMLVESETNFLLMFETMQLPASITDFKTGKIIYINHQFENITGYPKTEIIGKTTLELNLWKYPQQRLDFITKLASENRVIDFKGTFITKSGEERICLLNASIMKTKKEKLILAVIFDITDLEKRKEELEILVNRRTEELKKANETLKTFINSISHDLKEPLRSISGFSEILKEKLGKENLTEELKQHLDFIIEATERMGKMIEGLSEYTKLEKEKMTLGRIPLEKVLKDVMLNLDSRIKETSAKITIYGKPPILTGNTMLLTKIFQNLLSNSLKFRKKDIPPEIEIKFEFDGQKHLIYIIDNGIGFNEKYKDKIFNLFQRLHSYEEFEGLGLGLAIVKKCVDLLGGEISVKSKEGKGSEFIIIFPD